MSARGFLRDTRAGASAIAAAAVTVMTVGGAALIGDHVWLVDQRDTLKAASDAAGIAATVEFNRQMVIDNRIGDAELEAALQAVARRYVVLNLEHLSSERLARAKESLAIDLEILRDQGVVTVSVEGDLGGTLVARMLPMFGEDLAPERMRTQTGVERDTNPVEVVLAIDISASMHRALVAGGRPRIDIVKSAGAALVDTLGPGPENRVAIGLVPWHMQVRLDVERRERWAANGWARYAETQHYAAPYYCTGRSCTVEEAVDALPQPAVSPWRGCLDEHRLAGTRAALPTIAEAMDTPGRRPFAQSYYPSGNGRGYECLDEPLPHDYRSQFCYDLTDRTLVDNQRQRSSQAFCHSLHPTLLPLTSERNEIDDALDDLAASGESTYSSLGVLWAHRMLSFDWHHVWGEETHPVDPDDAANEGTRKAIVLLTDGQDTYCERGNVACDGSRVGLSRTEACTIAKAAGHRIYVIAAMEPHTISTALAETLRRCSSESDDPAGTYVFINNDDDAALEAAFASIANQLITLRRVL